MVDIMDMVDIPIHLLGPQERKDLAIHDKTQEFQEEIESLNIELEKNPPHPLTCQEVKESVVKDLVVLNRDRYVQQYTEETIASARAEAMHDINLGMLPSHDPNIETAVYRLAWIESEEDPRVQEWHSNFMKRNSLNQRKRVLVEKVQRINVLLNKCVLVQTELNHFLPRFIGPKNKHMGIYMPGSNQDTLHLHRSSGSKIMKQKFMFDTVWTLRNQQEKVVATIDETTGLCFVREDPYIVDKLVELGIQKEKAIRNWARDHGVCMMCNSALTDETSRKLGMGPDCRKKFSMIMK